MTITGGFVTMNPSPALKRWLAVAVTATVFAVVLVLVACGSRPSALRGDEDKKDPKKEASGDWPQYGGTLQRNFVNTREHGLPDKWDVENKTNVLWSADLGSKGYGGPVVAGGKVFVGTNNDNPRDPKIKGDKGVVMCFDEKTGKFLWQAVHDKLTSGLPNDWPHEGICSSPFVEGDRLYYVSNRCEVVCADLNGDSKGKAKFIWKFDMIGKLGVSPHNLAVCSPIAVGDLLFVVTANGVDEGHINIPKPQAPSFIALHKKDGEVAWTNNFPTVRLVEAKKTGQVISIEKLKDQGLVLMHGQWSNPVYAEPNGKPIVIFPGGDGWLYAFQPKSGDLVWRFDCNPKNSFYKLAGKGTRNDFIGTPVVWENKLYIGVGQDPEHKTGVGHLWCIDITKTPKNKDKDLSPVDDNFDPKSPKNKDSALVWHYGGVTPKGVESDRPYLFGRTLSTCAVHDGLCYAADLNGFVYCFDAKTGEKYWEEDTEGQFWCSPYWVDGKIYIGNDDGNVFVFKHGKEKKLLQKFESGATQVRAPMVAANGALFVLTENPTKLYAIKK
jgi:outer membrane protein assembly factor BamB